MVRKFNTETGITYRIGGAQCQFRQNSKEDLEKILNGVYMCSTPSAQQNTYSVTKPIIEELETRGYTNEDALQSIESLQKLNNTCFFNVFVDAKTLINEKTNKTTSGGVRYRKRRTKCLRKQKRNKSRQKRKSFLSMSIFTKTKRR